MPLLRSPNSGGILQYKYRIPQQNKNPIISPQQAYNASIPQTASDYDRLMKGFSDFGRGGTDPNLMSYYQQMYQNAGNFSPVNQTPFQPDTINPELVSYRQTPDVTSAIANLRGLAETGGLSESDISELRARGTSPIRSVYANAIRNLNRQRALSGGYAPGVAGATSRMARELSEQIAQQTTNVNADIASKIQQGRLSASPQLAELVAREEAAQRDVEARNAAAKMSAAEQNVANRMRAREETSESNRLNAEMYSRAQQQRLESIRGMQGLRESDRAAMLEALRGQTSLYGTTPALAELFGRQAMQQEELGLRKKEMKQRRGLGLIQAASRGR